MAQKGSFSPQDQDRVDRDKKLLITAGSIFFVTLIAVLWLFNFQTTLQDSKPTSEEGDQAELLGGGEELSDLLTEAQEQVKGFKATSSEVLQEEETESKEATEKESPESPEAVSDSFIRSLRESLEKESD